MGTACGRPLADPWTTAPLAVAGPAAEAGAVVVLITAAGIVARVLTGETVLRELARADPNARGDAVGDATGRTAIEAIGDPKGGTMHEATGDICRDTAAWPCPGAEPKSGRTSKDPAFEGCREFRSGVGWGLTAPSIEVSTASSTELSLKLAGVDRLLTGLEALPGSGVDRLFTGAGVDRMSTGLEALPGSGHLREPAMAATGALAT